MLPWPSTTMPSAGAVSCGKTAIRSPMSISSIAISVISPSSDLRCATLGMRLARALRADDALRMAKPSRTCPPVSINMIRLAARYSANTTPVTNAMAARKSAPISRRRSLIASCAKMGMPPTTNKTKSGRSAVRWPSIMSGRPNTPGNIRIKCPAMASRVMIRMARLRAGADKASSHRSRTPTGGVFAMPYPLCGYGFQACETLPIAIDTIR